MSFGYEVFSSGEWAQRAADLIADSLPQDGSIVLTGGTTVESFYPKLVRADIRWAGLDVLFSDDRCVPPNDPASNFGMARRLLLDHVSPKKVHRMRGEDPPNVASSSYSSEIAPIVRSGLSTVLLGMGADAHVGALYPGSRGVDERERLCIAVDRPDGLGGLTLTPPAMLAGQRVFLLVRGEGKAATVARAIAGDESPAQAPVRILAGHPAVTFLLDDAAASAL